MKAWHERLRDWEGTADELVQQVAELVDAHVSAKDFAPNVRLLRHYQSIGAVTRPRRQGKEAVYGIRQLLEVMVVRTLVLDGWPLAKIAEITSTASERELLRMLPDPEPQRSLPNMAQELVTRYSVGDFGIRDSDWARAGRTANSERVDETWVPSVQDDATATFGMLELIELEPVAGVRLSIDRRRLQTLRAGDIGALTNAIERALTDARRRVRGDNNDD